VSERARIVSWWAYVVVVLAIFEATLRATNFAYAVGAALLAIVVLGLLLKAIIRFRTRGRSLRSGPTRAPRRG
jgi:hypothetical protein